MYENFYTWIYLFIFPSYENSKQVVKMIGNSNIWGDWMWKDHSTSTIHTRIRNRIWSWIILQHNLYSASKNICHVRCRKGVYRERRASWWNCESSPWKHMHIRRHIIWNTPLELEFFISSCCYTTREIFW